MARRVCDRFVSRFSANCRWRDRPIGPHTKPNFRVRFSKRQFGQIVAWLMLHREGLSVLVHPYTENRVADHSDRALWLGKGVRLNFKFLRRLTTDEKPKRRKAP